MPKPLHERARSFYDVFDRKGGDSSVTHYCPGCGHGNIHKYVAEAIDDLGIADRVIFVNPVGCSVFAYYYLNVGHVQAPHGRAPAVATAIKRARPDSIVICYQGDGDLAAIGGNEILQASNRGENITVIFVNNALYGMTGGQMAPTTLIGQVTATTPFGRSAEQEGYPMKVSELIGSLDAPQYIERVAIGDAKHDMSARKAIRKALANQVEGRGYSLVEILSPCPTGWKMEPRSSTQFVLDTMTNTYPLGVVRDRKSGESSRPPTGRRAAVDASAIPAILELEPADAQHGPLAQAWSASGIEPRFRNPRIKAAGFGGQGVLFLGALVAEAGMLAGFEVSWLPSYGPEMRGGTAHCHVNLAGTEVDSPLVTRTSVLFAFNRPSLERFLPDMDKGGIVILDSSLIAEPPAMPEGVETIALPATTIAEGLGSARFANLVALGAYIGRTGVLPREAIRAALSSHHLRTEAVERNMKALEEGMRAVSGAEARRAG